MGPNWKSLCQEIILSKKYTTLQEQNALTFTEKLQEKYSNEVHNAHKSGLLMENATFLENLLILNNICPKTFLSFCFQFFSTKHLLQIDKSLESVEDYMLRNQKINCAKKNAILIHGVSNVGKTLLAEVLLDSMQSAHVMQTSKRFALSRLLSPCNAIYISELSLDGLSVDTLKMLFGAESLAIEVYL